VVLALEVLIALVILFGVGAFVGGRLDGLVRSDGSTSSEATGAPPGEPEGLPAGALAPNDLETVRFDVVWRGYSMRQVDTALARAEQALRERDDEIARLRSRADTWAQAAREAAEHELATGRPDTD
jgi:DivIVA domain-containing protein